MSNPQTTQNPELLPTELPSTDLGINKIREDIAKLKEDAQALETKRSDFEKNKKTLVKEESDKREQEIESEATRIEAKKQELLTLVKQTTGELETLKGSVETSTEKSQLEQLAKEIQEIQGKKKNILETSWSRVKENPGKTALFATGVGVLIRGVAKLFKKKKESSEGSGETKKEKKKGKFRKRALGIGAGIGAIFGINRLIDKFKGDTLKKPEALASDFDKLSEAEKLKYTTFGGKVNGMYGKIYQKEITDGLLNDADLGNGYNSTDKVKYAGVVPFAMDKTYDNVNSMISEGAINRHIRKKDVAEYKTLLVGFGKDKLASLLGPSLMKIASFNLLGRKPGENISEKIMSRLDTNTQEACQELDFFFRQFVMVLTYLEEKKIQLRRLLVIQKINESGYGSDKKKLTGLDEDDQNDIIEDALNDADRMKKNIDETLKAEFDTAKISTIDATLSKYQMYDENISKDLEAHITSLDQERDDLLDYDKDLGTDILDRAETDIADGSLEKDTQTKLAKCAGEVLDDAIDANGEGFMQTYFEPIAIACGMDAAAREKFLQESGGKEMLVNFALGMTKYKEKFTAGTMTKEDVTNFKIIVNKYLAFKKEAIVAIHTMQNISSDNPDHFTRAINAFWAPFKGLYECFTERMPRLQRVAHFSRGMMAAGGTLYLVGGVLMGKKLARVAGKNMVKIGGLVPYLVFRGTMAGVRYAGGRMVFSGMYRERKILDSKDPEKLFRRVLMSGEIKKDRALRIAKKLGIKTTATGAEIRNINDLLIKYGAKDVAEAELIMKYIDNPTIKKLITTKIKSPNIVMGDWIKNTISERALSYEYEFAHDNLTKLKAIDDIIKSHTTKSSEKVMNAMLRNIDAKQFDRLHTMITNTGGGLLDDIDTLFVRMGSKLDAKKFGKLLSSHLDQFTDTADVQSFFNLLESSNIDTKNFAIMIRKRKEIKIRLTKGEKLPDILKKLSKNFIRITPEIKIIADLPINKVAHFLYEKRVINGVFDEAKFTAFLQEFEAKGKYAKYSGDFKAKYMAAKTNPATLQELDTEFAKRLLRDGNKVEDLLEFTSNQKSIAALINKDIDELTNFIKTDLPKQGGGPGSILDIHYHRQLESLQRFTYEVEGFSPQEMISFDNLRAAKFRSTHIVELFELGKTNTEIQKVLTAGGDDVVDLLAVLDAQKNQIKGEGKQISKGLLEGLEKIASIRKAAKITDPIVDTIKSIFKLVAKVT